MRKWIRFIAIACVAMAILAGTAGYLLVFAPVTTEFEGSRSIKIPPGSEIETVADSLVSRGILAKRRSFLFFARLSGWGNQVKAGHYLINGNSSSRDILDRLRRGLQEPVRVSVPAGTRKERLAAALAQNMAFSAQQALDALRDTEFAQSLSTDTTQLFGYLLPDTYFFYWLASPETVITRLKEAADSLVAEERRVEDENMPDLNTDEILRLAAIVEWETAHAPEKARIAGVYLNRIRNRWPLQADPTIQFAVMLREGAKRRLLFADYDLRHPYNTYNYRGLPPGPITNPSASSIRSVLHPERHDYFFFVATGDGTHLFSRTLAEHNRRANEYRRLMRQRRAQEARSGS